MKANYAIEAGDVRVIRPLVYCREKATRDFSIKSSLPIINENCPACFEQPKERARIKKLLAQEESMVPSLFNNLRKALVPLMHDETYVAMQNVIRNVDRNEQLGKTKPKSSIINAEDNDDNDATEDTVSAERENGGLCSINGYCPPCFELA